MDMYQELIRGMGTLKEASEESNGVDMFLSENRLKVSSLSDLFNFSRLSDDTLVHKSEKDLWKISENKRGDVIIERLFDPNTEEALRI